MLNKLYTQSINLAERTFKTDMHYVLKGGFWLSVGQFFTLLSGLALSVVFANTLPKEVYGNYKFILTIAGVLSGLSLTGMGTVIVQAVARGAEGVLKEGIRTHLRFGLLIVSAGLVTSVYYFINNNFTLGIGVIVASLALPIIGSFGLYGSLLTGRKSFKHSTIFWSIGQTVNVLAMVIASLLTHRVSVLVLTYFATQVATTLIFYRYVINKWPPNQTRDPGMITYGKHISVMNLFGTVANQLDKILVFHYLGAAELAIYTFAFALPEQIKGSFKNIFNIALPKYASLPLPKLRASIIDKVIRLTALTALIVVAYILLSPYLYQLLFPQYLDSIYYSQIYSLGLLAIPGISLFSTYFQLRQKTSVLYKVNIIGNVSTIVLTFILISKYGLLGAVLENGLSWLALFGITCYYFATDDISVYQTEEATSSVIHTDTRA